MPTYDDVQKALANEARKSAERQKIANFKGVMDTVSSLAEQLATLNNDTLLQMEESRKTLAALEAGAGPGITDDYGPKSAVTQMIEAERWAAKDAAIDFIQANPECAEADVVQAWETAALASHPAFTSVIQPGAVMLLLYRANMLEAKLIPDNTWESQRAWLLAHDKATIMGA